MMTERQRQLQDWVRAARWGHEAIARRLGYSVSTVKTEARRQRRKAEAERLLYQRHSERRNGQGRTPLPYGYFVFYIRKGGSWDSDLMI